VAASFGTPPDSLSKRSIPAATGMKRIALKIDVDTCHGALYGVPALLDMLQRHDATATFFFSLGPDYSGRQTGDDSLTRYYDRRTRLYGRLLPAPDIGRRAVAALRQVRQAACEVAIHAWNRAQWENLALNAANKWSEQQLRLACRQFEDIFAESPFAHAAAGWRSNRHALRLTQRLGFCYASDCRGKFPFIPVIDGELVHCPQLPTTLPTLDEMLAQPLTPLQAGEQILAAADAGVGDQVFTLRAELEGMRFADVGEQLLGGWRARGYALITLRELLGTRNIAQLPRHRLRLAEIPGRTGLRLCQGPLFPAD